MDEIKDIPTESEATDSSRRGFLKKGVLLSAPVVLSAFSRPVLATVTRCGVSGLQSGFQSQGRDFEECTMGHSPGWWKVQAANGQMWPSPLNTGSCTAQTVTKGQTVTKEPQFTVNKVTSNGVPQGNNTSCEGFPIFSDYFVGGSDIDMLTILRDYMSSRESQFVAALLNAYDPTFRYALTVAEVKALWLSDPYGSTDLLSSTWDDADW